MQLGPSYSICVRRPDAKLLISDGQPMRSQPLIYSCVLIPVCVRSPCLKLLGLLLRIPGPSDRQPITKYPLKFIQPQPHPKRSLSKREWLMLRIPSASDGQPMMRQRFVYGSIKPPSSALTSGGLCCRSLWRGPESKPEARGSR